jgi:hypothetical protein
MNQIAARELMIEDVVWSAPRSVVLSPSHQAGLSSVSALVVGCSDQIPNMQRAYHLLSTSARGDALLSRHDGTTYTGTIRELSFYRGALATMIGSVLQDMPPSFRDRARTALLKRWNREWGVAPLAVSCSTCEREGHIGVTKRPTDS